MSPDLSRLTNSSKVGKLQTVARARVRVNGRLTKRLLREPFSSQFSLKHQSPRWLESPASLVAQKDGFDGISGLDINGMHQLVLHTGHVMKAVSVRELRNNPSAALRAAHENPVIVLNRQRPEALLVHLEGDSILDEPGIRLALATALYREKSISLGRAARFSGIPLAEFIQYLSQLGIPVAQGTAASVREDVDAIRKWRKCPRNQ